MAGLGRGGEGREGLCWVGEQGEEGWPGEGRRRREGRPRQDGVIRL